MSNESPSSALEYQTPSSRPISGWAIASLALSIMGALFCFLLVPPLVTWLLAVIVHRWLARRNDVNGRGIARAAMYISGWAMPIGLVVQLMLPSLGHEHY